MTRAAFAAGLPAPEVFDEVTLEGRFGIVLSRLDGPTLLQLLRTRTMTPEQAGAILAALSISVHKTPPYSGNRLSVGACRGRTDSAHSRSASRLAATQELSRFSSAPWRSMKALGPLRVLRPI